MEHGLGARSPFTIGCFLEGISFPCLRDDTVNHAEDNHTPEEVLDLLELLPDRLYKSVEDVARELRRVA